MADTDIEWATKVWNPTRGCRRVSPGCGGPNGAGGCYAEKQAYRFSGPGQPYEGLVTLGAHGPRWTGAGRFVHEKLAEPLGWKQPKDGSRHRIFVNSMSDLFFEAFTNEEIAACFGVMAACEQHDFLVLTKRPERALEWFAWHEEQTEADGEPWIPIMREAISWLPDKLAERLHEDGRARDGVPELEPWPLPNVWLGVSAENQRTADQRIPLLLRCPATVRWVSAEPLLELIDFRPYLFRGENRVCPKCMFSTNQRITDTVCPNGDGGVLGPDIALDWLVCGGESGPGARPCDIDWIESIVGQCRDAKTPVFVKQLGSKPLVRGGDGVDAPSDRDRSRGPRVIHLLRDRKGGDPLEWSERLRVREFPQ